MYLISNDIWRLKKEEKKKNGEAGGDGGDGNDGWFVDMPATIDELVIVCADGSSSFFFFSFYRYIRFIYVLTTFDGLLQLLILLCV